MLLTDLRELKATLAVDPNDQSEDVQLGFYIEWASALIEDFLGRGDLSRKSRTEYYQGTGTQRLALRSRPVFTSPAVQVWVDRQGYYGAASGAFSASDDELTYGGDYTLEIDQPDGSSRSGVLVRLGGYWPRPSVRQAGLLSPFVSFDTGSVKVTYTAGWTSDSLPSPLRAACNLLCAKLRHLFPLGVELTSESYEERSISWQPSQKAYLLGMVKPLIWQYRNWTW